MLLLKKWKFICSKNGFVYPKWYNRNAPGSFTPWRAIESALFPTCNATKSGTIYCTLKVDNFKESMTLGRPYWNLFSPQNLFSTSQMCSISLFLLHTEKRTPSVPPSGRRHTLHRNFSPNIFYRCRVDPKS